ncbi:tyrosine-type recombinase/integrase [Streptomyces sp. NPDC045456]|uniref:tyrosine-type recombinase/integrase n=1 Tax=Streptomyces sp. NPDC045456 TaxID=3155254 RepID=UPI0033BFDCA4
MDGTVPIKIKKLKKAQRAIAEWLGSKKEGTRREYERDITRYAQHCIEVGVNPLKAKPNTVRGFLDRLKDEYQLAASTRLRAYKVLSSFYGYAVDLYRKECPRNPMRHVDPPKIDEDDTTLGLTMAEAIVLLRAAYVHSMRLYALTTVLLLTGLRISELLGADIEDLDVVEGQRVLWVMRKGREKKKAMPLPEFAYVALMAYLGDRRSGPLFITLTGRRLCRDGAHDTITRLARRARLPHVFPHLIRATTTSLLLELKQAIERVQAVLGHDSPKTTVTYNKIRQNILHSPLFVLEAAVKEGMNAAAGPRAVVPVAATSAQHHDQGELLMLLDTAA